MKNSKDIYKLILALWTTIMLVGFFLLYNEKIKDTDNVAKGTIDTAFNQDAIFRFWATSHGGVYVKTDERTPPNPNLSHIPNRDVKTENVNLTLMNPAYMLRQMMDEYEGMYGLKGHITSLKAFNTKYNSPDEWEKKVLDRVEKTKNTDVYYEYIIQDGKEYLRAFEPLVAKQGCLKCHGIQGYKVGDIRGGVSMTLPMEELNSKRDSSVSVLILSFLGVYIAGVLLIIYFYKRIVTIQEKEKALERELKKSEKYYKGLVNTSKDIILVNYNQEIQMVNNTFFEFTGFKTVEAFKEKYDCICDLFIEQEGCLTKKVDGEYWTDYIYNHPEQTHKALMEKDGKVYTFIVVVNKLAIDEKTMYSVALSDITKLVEKEEMMLIQSRHAAMGEMISMIAHQWRQPITAIAMNANNILADIELFGKVENEELKELSNMTLAQTEHLSRTIDDFKNFFKPHVDKEEIDIKQVIEECLEIVGKSLENNNITLEKEYKNTTKVTIFSREFLQVLINIIKNGKEALALNKIKDAKLIISTYEDEDWQYVKICDNGLGIDKSIMKKIFDPYFTTKDEKNGTGLGLYMSRTIVEKHLKGTLECYNDNGACFVIKLPLKDKK